MLATNISHALGLHMHQPPGNLALLMEANVREAEQIIRCYERPPRYAQQYADVGHLHVGEDWLPRLAALTDAADAIIGALEAGGAAGEAAVEGAQDPGLGSRR